MEGDPHSDHLVEHTVTDTTLLVAMLAIVSDSATLIAAAEGEKATSEPASQQKDDDTENPGKNRRFFLNISFSMLEAVLALDCGCVGWPLAFFESGFDLFRLFSSLHYYDGSNRLLHLHAWLHHHGLLLHGLTVGI